jgi:hypothetical protein
MTDKLSLYKELEKNLKEKGNSNFHLDKVGWTMEVVIKELCSLIDKRINEATKLR